MELEDTLANPWCRATLAAGAVTLNPWSPALIRGGPAAMSLERLAERGVALADLFAEGDPGDEELFVRYVARLRTDESDATLLDWARTVGYLRVWFPDRVVDLDPCEARRGLAETTCTTCGLEWRDDTDAFWNCVLTGGAFPGSCLACGASLPEWRVVTDDAAASVRDGAIAWQPGS